MNYRYIFYWFCALTSFIIGIAGIYYLTENVLYQIIAGSGGIITSISIFYFFIIHFPSFQKVMAPILSFFNFIGKAELASIAFNIQGNINEFRESINYESDDLIPEAEVEWITEESEESFYNEYENKVIIRMKPSKNNDINLTKATLLQVTKGVIPGSRIYINDKMNTSINLSLVKKILLNQEKNNAYRYLLNDVIAPKLVDKKILGYMESIEDIDKKGLFTRLFLRELKELPIIEGLGFSNLTEINLEIEDFFKYALQIARRKQHELINLNYDGLYVKTAVIMVARSIKMSIEGIQPYISRALLSRHKMREVLFIIAYDHAIRFTKMIVKELVEKHGMIMINNSDIEYTVNEEKLLCVTLLTNASRYSKSDEYKEVLNKVKNDDILNECIDDAIKESTDESGWAHFSLVGNKIKESIPDFNLSNYGAISLRYLFYLIDKYEFAEIQKGVLSIPVIMVRRKENR